VPIKSRTTKSADQAAWIKAEDHIAGLLNDDQMLTMENTDQSIKKYETYAARVIDTNTTVLLASASNDDNPEMVVMRAEIAEMRALMATTTPAATTGAAHTGKRARVHKNGKTTVPKAVITCTVCKKNGHDTQDSWFNAENKVKEVAKMKSDAEDILKSKKSNKKAYTAGFPADEPNEECSNCVSLKCYRACTDTYAMPSSRFHARSAVLDQVFVPDTTASILDSGAMASITQGTQGTGSRVQLVGVTGDGIAEIADVTFPVLTATNELYVIDTTNSRPVSTLLVEKTKDNIISLAVLLKADFKVDFAVGRADDSCFGGILYTPEGILIEMVFHDDLWHIPMWRPPSIVPPLPSLCPAVKVNNYYRALDATSRDKRAAKTITAIIATLLQRSTPKAIRFLLNKASSATAYTD
jgi:hypothetical protein